MKKRNTWGICMLALVGVNTRGIQNKNEIKDMVDLRHKLNTKREGNFLCSLHSHAFQVAILPRLLSGLRNYHNILPP